MRCWGFVSKWPGHLRSCLKAAGCLGNSILGSSQALAPRCDSSSDSPSSSLPACQGLLGHPDRQFKFGQLWMSDSPSPGVPLGSPQYLLIPDPRGRGLGKVMSFLPLCEACPGPPLALPTQQRARKTAELARWFFAQICRT